MIVQDDDPMNPPLTAGNGASFEGTIQHTPAAAQARYLITLERGNGTLSETAIRVFGTEEEALSWINGMALARGFSAYSIFHEDENGDPLSQGDAG